MHPNSFGAKGVLDVGDSRFEIFRLDALQGRFDVAGLPFSLKILLENLLRNEGFGAVAAADIEALAGWDAKAEPSVEIAFTPARVLMQDFTGVPAVVDLAAMRDAIVRMGGRGAERGAASAAAKINPLVPAELVIDHSVQVDAFGTRDAFKVNADYEFERNRERYAFLRWGQHAFDRFAVVPPDTGIVHQVNIEYLARVVFPGPSDGPESGGARARIGSAGGHVDGGSPRADDHPESADTRARVGLAGEDREEGLPQAYPDTLVGTDSHTTMVNGLGVLGWGVGGIEAEAAMLGQAMSMLIPQVLGVQLHGELPEGATATDLVLTVTELLRARGVVGKFVEFYGPGVAALPIADRATIGNMSPEFGSTCAIFPVDAETIRYLELTGRQPEQLALVEAYARAQGLWHDEDSEQPAFSDTLDLDLSTVEPSIAGPKRPQERVALSQAKAVFEEALREYAPSDGDQADAQDEAVAESYPASDPPAGAVPGHGPLGAGAQPRPSAGGAGTGAATALPHNGTAKTVEMDGQAFEIDHGDVVIAAITSCTNTSNPSVMVGAGILARNALAKGLKSKPWVKTSLAPGSKVVTEYLDRAGLTPALEGLGFNLVGYGCTTCIGNSGPLPEAISEAVGEGDLAVVSVLSGNRNFEGRINPDVKMNYLASPPLCVAYAIAGTMDIDLINDPLGRDGDGEDVYLRDIWPSEHEVAATVAEAVRSDMFRRSYGEVFAGDERWNGLPIPAGERFEWAEDSTYVRLPPYFEDMPAEPEPVTDVDNARVLALLGDSVTTDHISPAGAIKRDGPAGTYLQEQGVAPRDFNSYGSRRGNHEVMMRGTFANIRLRNLIGSPTQPGAGSGWGSLPEGGFTRHLPDGQEMSIYDAAMRYIAEGVPLVVLAGKEYGSGSSRDWAAKGTRLLGVRAVIARSFERIHRSNLVGMGVLPLQFGDGESAQSLGLTGEEVFTIGGLAESMDAGGSPPRTVTVKAGRPSGERIEFEVRVRIDTPREADYYRHGGILQYVLRMLLAS